MNPSICVGFINCSVADPTPPHHTNQSTPSISGGVFYAPNSTINSNHNHCHAVLIQYEIKITYSLFKKLKEVASILYILISNSDPGVQN